MPLFTRTEHWTHGATYYPCRVLETRGEDVLVQDDTGATFDSHLSLIALLPRGYAFVEGKLTRLDGPGNAETGIQDRKRG
ncbi:MAG: hypothetical protein U0793_26405 [Gemmataceae bacterium]